MDSLGLLIPVTPRNQMLRAATLVLCVLVFSLGASIFSGWLWDIPTLLRVFSGAVTMKPNAALGLIVCSTTLALLVWSGTPAWVRHVLTGVALAVAVMATLTLSQDIFGWNLGIDQWLFLDPDTSGRSTPGRVSPPAAFCFALIGIALATLSRPPSASLRLPIASALGSAVIVISALSLGGHLANVLQGNRSWNFSPVAVDTALSFLLLGVALLLVARSEGGLSWFTDRLVVGGFVAGILGLLIAAGTAYYFARQLQSNAVLVSHTQDILKGIEELKSDLGDTTSTLRGYVITGDERLVTQRNQKTADVQKTLQSLRKLMTDDAPQLRQLDQLEPLLILRSERGNRIIEARRTQGFEAARQMMSGDGTTLTAQVTRRMDALRDHEYELLKNRQRQSAQSARDTFLTLPLGVFVSITTLLMGLFLLNATTGERLRMEEARRESEAWFRAMFEATPDGIIMTDAQKAIVMANPGAEKMYGYARGAMTGIPISRIAPGLESEAIIRERAVLLANPASPSGGRSVGRAWQLEATRADGTTFPIEVIRNAFTSPRGTYIVGVTRDITERVKMQDDLRQREAGLHRAQIVARLSHVITQPDGTFDSWSDSLMQMIGLDFADMPKTTRAWLDLLHPEDREHFRLKAIEAGITGARTELEYRLRRADGTWLHIRQVMEPFDSPPDANGQTHWFNTIQDVSERKQAEARIEYLATHDELTDLPNRNLIRDRITQAISHARRAGRQLALVYLDIDRFKVINDAWGHPFGDVVLKAVGERLMTVVRGDDTVARLSGDEFLLLLADVRKSSDTYIVAQKALDAFARPFLLDNREVYVGVSMGVSIYPQDGDDADALISNADVAMYRSKDLGRGTYQFFKQEMSRVTRQQVDMETRLRVAIEHQEFRLVYQPKVDMASGKIVGSEALLRWTQPELGEVSPVRFIPIAEESGLIVPIGDWVLRTACLQNRAWLDAGLRPGVVSVNVSARQFLQQDVVAWVLTTLKETGLAPELLELELTESLMAQDTEKVIATVTRLKAAGVRLSIDDFGTGYSSLSYLRRFRVDTLKIDQSFIRNMRRDPEDAVIALAVISLAHSLQLKVIAEGVETVEDCDFLHQHGCDEMQGYYFSKPVSPAEYAWMLTSGKNLRGEAMPLLHSS